MYLFVKKMIVFMVLKFIKHKFMEIIDKFTLRNLGPHATRNPFFAHPCPVTRGIHDEEVYGQSNSKRSEVHAGVENLIAMRFIRNELQFMRFSYFRFPLHPLPHSSLYVRVGFVCHNAACVRN
jgi:hypothetical protein